MKQLVNQENELERQQNLHRHQVPKMTLNQKDQEEVRAMVQPRKVTQGFTRPQVEELQGILKLAAQKDRVPLEVQTCRNLMDNLMISESTSL